MKNKRTDFHGEELLLKKVFERSDKRHEDGSYSTEFECHRKDEYRDDCKKCMKDLNYHNTNCEEEEKPKYDCLKLADYYVGRYITKYASEMVYAIRAFPDVCDPERYPAFNIVSLGCGDAADLMAFDYLKQRGELTQPIHYLGMDLSEEWRNVQADITEFVNRSPEDQVLFKRGIDAVTRFEDHEVVDANVISIQYLISYLYDYDENDLSVARKSDRDMRAWYRLLIERIVKNKPKDKPMLILINDVNSSKTGAATFKYFEEELREAGFDRVQTKIQRFLNEKAPESHPGEVVITGPNNPEKKMNMFEDYVRTSSDNATYHQAIKPGSVQYILEVE